jgi:hypothetical protein
MRAHTTEADSAHAREVDAPIDEGPDRGVRLLLEMQRSAGNRAVQRLIGRGLLRQPRTGPPPPAPGVPQTVTNLQAVVREGPDDFKSTGATIPVGTRVDVVETRSAKSGTFVKVAEHGTGKDLGWTSRDNLGDAQYAKAAASFVYMARVKPREGHRDQLPIMVYVSEGFDGTKAADIVLYLHGDAADYSVGTSDNYTRENPAIGMHLKGGPAGSNRIVIAPQVNEWHGKAAADDKRMASPWHTLQAGDYETIVGTSLANLKEDLKLTGPIARGGFSIAGHSGGGKGLGQAVQDLAGSGAGVKDVTLVEAGYGGGEDAKGSPDGKFAASFQMVRGWMLDGPPGKVLRVITKATTAGDDTRHAIENAPTDKAGRVPVLSLEGVRHAITAKGLDGELQAVESTAKDTVSRTGGMQLVRTITVTHKTGGAVQGTIYVFLMADPPRDKDKVDRHFGVRDATIDDIASSQGKGADFGHH